MPLVLHVRDSGDDPQATDALYRKVLEGPQFAAGHPPPLLSRRLGHGKALAQLVPWNLFRVHDVGERVRGEAEAGVEVSTRQQAAFTETRSR